MGPIQTLSLLVNHMCACVCVCFLSPAVDISSLFCLSAALPENAYLCFSIIYIFKGYLINYRF